MYFDEKRMVDRGQYFFFHHDSFGLSFFLNVFLFQGFDSIELGVAFFANQQHLRVGPLANHRHQCVVIERRAVFHFKSLQQIKLIFKNNFLP